VRFHRLDRPRDANFWTVRINDDIRLIVHRTAASMLLCYIAHHDTAYGWAERRRIERHPTIEIFADADREAGAFGRWVADRMAEGAQPHEIGIFVRSSAQLRRARAAAKQSGAPAIELSEKVETTPERLSIGTMHLTKGLEFRAVAVMGCDDEVLPLQERIEAVGDYADRRRLQHRVPPALRRLHPRSRSSAGDRRQARIRVLRRPDRIELLF
jgi:hypothetical protein